MTWKDSIDQVQEMFRTAQRVSGADAQLGPDANAEVIAQMAANRAVNRKLATGSSVTLSTGRPVDPLFYWRNANLPYNIWEKGELEKVRAFCNTPDAPVWMGDYSFKPIGEITEGDEVMGWTYQAGPQGELRKKICRTTVLATQRRWAPEIVRVTLESGEVIRCTPDHLWANPLYTPGNTQQKWQQPEFRPAEVGRELVRFIRPTPELMGEKERAAAMWLGGLYDGEGCGEGIAQSRTHNPDVCQRIEDSLDLLGLPWTYRYNKGRAHSYFIRRQGSRRPMAQQLVDFLNWTKPTRRQTKALDDRLLACPNGGRDRIVSIESEGPGEVVSMQTETGNYTAWGLASKNCRLLYILHPIIGSCVDIFSKYPLTGMEVVCPKDSKIADFYGELFLDQLDYEDFLIDVGREYWTVGEAMPFGTFSELLGVWEADELLNPDDIKVIRSPFLLEPRFEMRLPEPIRKILRERKPQLEYNQLIQSFPEMASMPLGEIVSEDDQLAWMPVSNMLLSHLKFKGDTFHERGVPILLRAFRSVMQEEMLNAAQEAIASRLYTPLILARLGASATDLGTDVPWIPTQGDLDTFNDALNAALAADFRVMVHHFAVDMQNVFGRENMPQLGDDFDRLTEKILQTFGLSKTMLSGGSSGETYAADALNRDLISQLLTTYQKRLRRFFKKRCEIVAEAQGHYDFDMKGGRPIPIMEEVVETDAETGEQRIIQRPKLLLPDLRIQAMNMRDEDQFRQFVEGLRATGVPISMRTRLTNVPIDLEDEEQAVIEEQVRQAVAAQEARKQTYLALKRKGLPIPEDLLNDFQPRLPDPATVPAAAPEEQVLDTLGINNPSATDALVPTPEEMIAAEESGTAGQEGEMSGAVVQMLPKNQVAPLLLGTGEQHPGQSTRPAESDEQRRGMPRAAVLRQDGTQAVAYDDLADVETAAARGPRTAGLRDVRAFYRRHELDDDDEVA